MSTLTDGPVTLQLKTYTVPAGAGPHDVAPAAGGGVWAYYVRTYHVRLPDAFLAHAAARGWAVPAAMDLTQLSL